MKRKLKWSEFIDPTEEFIKNKASQETDEDFDEDDEDEINGISSKLLNTPVGMTTVGGPVFISKYFHVWILDTNFDITPVIAEQVDAIPGVEGLQIVTRYKMRVAFPKSGFFDIEEVKRNIEYILLGEERQSNEQIDKFISNLFENKINFSDIRQPVCSKYSIWTIYILPNGHYEVIGGTSKTKEYDELFKIFKVAEHYVGGKVITNEDYE